MKKRFHEMADSHPVPGTDISMSLLGGNMKTFHVS